MTDNRTTEERFIDKIALLTDEMLSLQAESIRPAFHVRSAGVWWIVDPENAANIIGDAAEDCDKLAARWLEMGRRIRSLNLDMPLGKPSD